MNEKDNNLEESRFEKNFTPSLTDVRENTYTNAKGEEKHQCFISINKPKSIALVLPYSLDELKDKYLNDRYPDSLNIPVVKDFNYKIVHGSEFLDVNGTELRKHIDYFITINLTEAKMTELDNRMSVTKNGLSFIVNKDWIKDGQFGPYISVKHNNRVEVSHAKVEKVDGKYENVLDAEGNRVFEKREVSWAYVKKAYDSKHMNKAKDNNEQQHQTKKHKETMER